MVSRRNYLTVAIMMLILFFMFQFTGVMKNQLNEYRVKDALHLLTDKRYADKNVEEISAMVGFANRQSFYAAFYKNIGETPNGYRKRHLEDKK